MQNSYSGFVTFFLTILIIFTISSSTLAQVSGVSYIFTPKIEQTEWEKNSGLDKGYQFGGSFGLGFGPYIELSADYIRSYDQTFSLVSLRGGDELLNQRLINTPTTDISVERFGLSTRINLGTSALIPYLEAGTGLIRFSRNDLNSSQSVYLSGGAGLMLSLADRVGLFVQANHFGYSYNPGATFLSGSEINRYELQTENFRHVLVSQWNFQAGFKTYLGGSRDNPLYTSSLSEGEGVVFDLTPFYGQLYADESLNLRSTQHLTGFSLGVHLNPYISVNPFVWQGLETHSKLGFSKLNMYGGEFKAVLFDAIVTPTLVIGGGYLDASRYESASLARPESQLFGTVGAGFEIELTPLIRLNAGFKSMLTTKKGVDNAISPNDIIMSSMFSTGVQIRMGSFNSRKLRSLNRFPQTDSPQASASLQNIDNNDRLISRDAALSSQIQKAITDGDTLVARLLTQERDKVRQQLGLDAVDTRMITLPVLKDGEIYIRFGKSASGNVVLDSTRQSDRPSVPVANNVVTTEELEARFKAFEDRLIRLLESRSSSNEPSRIIVNNPTTVEQQQPKPVASTDTTAGRSIEGVSVYTGLATPFQGLFGVRLDYGTVFNNKVTLFPEMVLGFGSGTTMYHLGFNAVYPLDTVDYIAPFEPYAGLGVGIIAYNNPPSGKSGLQFAGGVLLGAEYEFGPGKAFAEYQAINLFSFNRLMIGYRYTF